jgi:asparagine N-glycosylation enzyme membrane subunit Stt3
LTKTTPDFIIGKIAGLRMSRISPKLLAGIFVAIFFGIALYIRIALPYDLVFTDAGIKYTGNDPYYHMHLIDNLIHNFPHLTKFDPYFIFPGGNGVGSIRFFEWFLGGIIWLIGKELFNRWAGIAAAALIAVMPGEFLGRSILGFTDNHVAETFFTTVTMLFLILAVKTARQRKLGFDKLNRQHWSEIAKPLIYSLLAGIFLGVYMLTWIGALLFVFIIAVFFVIQFIIDHLKHRATDYLCISGLIIFFIALVMSVPASPGSLYIASLVIALIIPPLLYGISRWIAARKIKVYYYPVALVALGVVAVVVLYAADPSLVHAMLDAFGIFVPSGVELTTMEMQPFLSLGGEPTVIIVWGNFAANFFFAFISLILLIYLAVRYGDADKSLLLLWSLVILAATIGQRRFAYYYAVNVAVLTGYLAVVAYYTVRCIIDYLRTERYEY